MLLLANLPVMPAVQQPLLFQRLLPLVAAIPSAAQRTRGLARLWSAVLQYDWSAQAARQRGAARDRHAGRRVGGARVVCIRLAASSGELSDEGISNVGTLCWASIRGATMHTLRTLSTNAN